MENLNKCVQGKMENMRNLTICTFERNKNLFTWNWTSLCKNVDLVPTDLAKSENTRLFNEMQIWIWRLIQFLNTLDASKTMSILVTLHNKAIPNWPLSNAKLSFSLFAFEIVTEAVFSEVSSFTFYSGSDKVSTTLGDKIGWSCGYSATHKAIDINTCWSIYAFYIV